MNTFVGNNKLIRMLRTYGRLSAVWPLDSRSGRFKALSYNVLWCIYLANGILEMIALLMSIPLYLGDMVNITKILVEFTVYFEVTFNIFYSKIRRKLLQKLLSEIEQSSETWTPYEEIVRKEFKRYTYAIYITTTIMYLVGSLSFSFSPLISHRIIPLNTMYPLPMSELWGRYTAYGLNLFSIYQATIIFSFDVMVIIILWNVAFKFKLVGMQMRTVFTADELRKAIIMHQTVISYVEEINRTISYAILKLMSVIFVYLISCNLLIIHNVPVIITIQFLSMSIIGVSRLYCYNWSAEMITNLAYDISWQLYDTPWIYATPNIRREIFIIIQRCQKPIVIQVPGVIPMLSIKFCGEMFCLTFSYFVTLRTILLL